VSPGEDARPAGCRPFYFVTLTREERIRAVMEKRQPDLQVILENVDDPHNLGAILRSCDAMGVGKVHLLYTNGRPPRMRELKTKAAASAAKWLDIQEWRSVAECVDALKAPLFVATLSSDGVAPWACDLKNPCVIALGNEHDGPSPALVAVAHRIITIPMQGFVESLNVSVAAAICLAETLRQRVTANRL
jgi:tRNA (guanosine-2'-O-)-methyltransferase